MDKKETKLNKAPEILAPAGNWEMLSAAIESGADAVYFGTKQLNMRATASNFELTELRNVVNKCHENNVKAYLTINTIIFDSELDKLKQILKQAKEADIDAIICWDIAAIKLAKELDLEIHLSTQASTANFEAIKFYNKQGVKRFILARELSLEQIKSIKQEIKNQNLDIEIETFIHGAMCVAVSGRCFTSQFLFNRSANRGDCIQPCRRSYKITDIEEGFELELNNNYVMSAKDLCTLPFIDKLIEAGIDSFKIEGRVKGPEYVKTVVQAYKEAIELAKQNNLTEQKKDELIKKLKTVYNRKLSSGFYLGLPTADDFTDIYGSNSKTKKTYIGFIKNFYKKINVAEIKIESEQLNKGDLLLITGPTTGAKQQLADSIEINHKPIEKAEKGQSIAVKLEFPARPNDKVFVLDTHHK
ncbi:U32 family peptidase [Candidatus Woesearchaeota archaeon]|nr:U32 family peptidase [Candidatus Woesearchaeota archaeon]